MDGQNGRGNQNDRTQCRAALTRDVRNTSHSILARTA
jgi:hypothetical protein